MEKYELAELPYGYNALEPYISEEVLKLHHTKHHASYVNTANGLLEKIEVSRKEDLDSDYKSVSKALSFNSAGHILHKIFWETMAPADSGKNEPTQEILKLIERDFGSFKRFKKEFTETAKSVEGSGWAILAIDRESKNLIIVQIEKHNVNFCPEQKILLCLDVWEHAYYLDYKNDRAKFIEQWWNIVNWQEVGERMSRTCR